MLVWKRLALCLLGSSCDLVRDWSSYIFFGSFTVFSIFSTFLKLFQNKICDFWLRWVAYHNRSEILHASEFQSGIFVLSCKWDVFSSPLSSLKWNFAGKGITHDWLDLWKSYSHRDTRSMVMPSWLQACDHDSTVSYLLSGRGCWFKTASWHLG